MPYYYPHGGWPSGDTTIGKIAQVILSLAILFLVYVCYRKLRDVFKD